MRWVIGDVHGMLESLRSLIGAITSFDSEAKLLFVGDYVNRGPDSRGVVDLLLSLANARFIRGNHDDIFDYLLTGHTMGDQSSVPDARQYVARFIHANMLETLASYDIDTARVLRALEWPDLDGVYAALDAVPMAHRSFFRGLPLVIEEEDIFVAHAWWNPQKPDDFAKVTGVTGERRRRHAVMWHRFDGRHVRADKPWRRTGYFGHTPVERFGVTRRFGNVPLRGPQIVMLDTGCAHGPTGRLTAVCAETGDFLQATPEGKIVGG